MNLLLSFPVQTAGGAVFLTVIMVLIGVGAFLPRLGRLGAVVFSLSIFLVAASIYQRDGGWAFIHNDIGVILLACIGGCLAIGALLREAVNFVNHARKG